MALIDWGALLLAPHYDLLGDEAVITPVSGGPVTVPVIDQTAGVLVEGHLGVATLRPAADVQVADITAAGLTRASLPRATITFNGGTWRIEAAKPRPGPDGEASGELRLFLSE